MTNVDLNQFLGNLNRPKSVITDGFTTLLLDRAKSKKVPLDRLPNKARSFIDKFASAALDPDDRGLIVMGFPKAGKSFLIEQFAYNLDYYIPKSNLDELHLFYVNDTNMMELGNSRNLRNWVASLQNDLNVKEENLCFVTESVEAAVFFMTALSKAKVILEINFDTFMLILHNNSRSANKMWGAWQVFDVNIPRYTKEEVCVLLYESMATRLNEKSQVKITKEMVELFVNRVDEVYSNVFVALSKEEDDEDNTSEKISIIPMGAWSFGIKHLLNALSFTSDSDFYEEDVLSVEKVIAKVVDDCESLFEIFLKNIRTENDEEEEDGEENGGIPQEILKLISGDGRVMTVGNRTQQKEVTPLIFKEVTTLEERLEKTILGQDSAVKQVASSLIVPAAGMHDETKPLKSFLFLGPTGVGKTQLALDLAKEVSEEPMTVTRIDMSEYQHEHEVAKLFGAPPGYVGFEKGGRLTSAVAENPHSLILLDEVEKAHPKIWDTFLQVFDSGHMTDSHGEVIDFTQTIIIMTSNLGVEELNKKTTGFGVGNPMDAYENRKKNNSKIVMNAVEKFFRPEFINRIDEIVMFNELSSEVITSIIKRELSLVEARAEKRGVALSDAPDTVISTLVQKSDISKYGAREIQRVVFKNVANPVSSYMVLNPTVKNILLTTENNEILVTTNTLERRNHV